ncbi:MAG: hypothetical protein M1837_002795 [Sclerophora amabilis]|nr:MAG: hypothetical protein M1837_002795 [Sclerophora amabilis]
MASRRSGLPTQSKARPLATKSSLPSAPEPRLRNTASPSNSRFTPPRKMKAETNNEPVAAAQGPSKIPGVSATTKPGIPPSRSREMPRSVSTTIPKSPHDIRPLFSTASASHREADPKPSSIRSISREGFVKENKAQKNGPSNKPSSAGQRDALLARTNPKKQIMPHDPRPRYHPGDAASMPDRPLDPFPETVFGIAPPPVVRPAKSLSTTKQRSQDERSKYSSQDFFNNTFTSDKRSHPPAPRDHPASIPLSVHTESPSTRYSESPGPFSRTSTPTTMSSYSPSVTVTPRTTTKLRQPSPVEDQPLPLNIGHAGDTASKGTDEPSVVPELLPTNDGECPAHPSSEWPRFPFELEKEDPKKKKKTKKRASPPPNPPPRKSSMRFNKTTPPKIKEPVPAGAQQQRRPSSPWSKIPRAEPSLTSSKSVSKSNKSQLEPPVRPTRDGAPDLDANLDSLTPVIQSNLTKPPGIPQIRPNVVEGRTNTRNVLRKNTNPDVESNATAGHERPGTSSRASSRNRSPSIRYQVRPGTSFSQLPSLSTTGTNLAPTDGNQSRGTSPLRGSSSRANSRVGFFSRRKKAGEEGDTSEQTGRTARKGPAAGTGHEGYGKYSTRGRSGSTTSASGSWARSTSNSSSTRSDYSRRDSCTSRGTQLDDFYLERLDPVVITGGTKAREGPNPSQELLPVDSSQGSVFGRPSIDSGDSGSTQFSLSSAEQNEDSVPVAKNTKGFTAPSDTGSIDDGPFARPSVPAPGPPHHRLRRFAKNGTLRVPASSTAIAASPSPSGDVHAGLEVSAVPSIIAHDDLSEGKEGNWLKSKSPEKRVKSMKKWNFFQRAQASTSSPLNVDRVTVVDPQERTAPAPAHYALLDSTDHVQAANLEEIVQEVEQNNEMDDVQNSPTTPRRERNGNSLLLPDPPILPSDPTIKRSPSPRVKLGSAESLTSQPLSSTAGPPSRPTRLAQVGRIPRVVSTKKLKASPQSFSRPFTPVSPRVATATSPPSEITFASPQSQDNRPQVDYSLPVKGPLSPSLQSDAGDHSGARSPINHGFDFSFADNEFLKFPPRKQSEVSYASSSEVASLVHKNDAIPDQVHVQRDEDIWKEYDDFIDEVLSPESDISNILPPCNQGGFIFPEISQGDFTGSRSNGTEPLTAGQLGRLVPRNDGQHSTGYPDLPNLQRDEWFPPALRPGPSSVASTSFSDFLPRHVEPPPKEDKAQPPSVNRRCSNASTCFSDFIAGRGKQHTNESGAQRPSTDERSSHVQSLGMESRPSSPFDDYEESIQNSRNARKDINGLNSGMNVRFAALMTSRWLSFGKVLFSPAHLEMKNATGFNKQNRLLVLDGLGNDDWSFYCALTYPAATVYNLSPAQSSAHASSTKGEPNLWQAPSNHRQIYHPSIANPFPFPKAFFDAVVFRFPVASSEEEFRSAISECKRVLRPGGFLEISTLDLDMMNMGNLARRALRSLKVRMHDADDAVSLRSASDNVQRLLGRRGFENLNRCTLAVPAAGTIADSRSNSIDENGPSLSELLSDQSQEGDVEITKMVAKVGRWWYSRCYETGVLSDGDLSDSLWNDKALLRECEMWQTSFKLLICYAQKPATPKRRTVSV